MIVHHSSSVPAVSPGMGKADPMKERRGPEFELLPEIRQMKWLALPMTEIHDLKPAGIAGKESKEKTSHFLVEIWEGTCQREEA